MNDDATPMRLLDGAAVDVLASPELGLAAAEAAARLERDQVATGRVQVNGTVSWSRILSGSITELDLFGYKEFHRVGKRVRYHVHLFQESTGNALGIVDGRRITSLRTSSTAAVAVRRWSDGTPVRVGVVGSGEEAREGLRALCGALPVQRASVFSPTPANRKAYADEMGSALGLDVVPHDSPDDVLADCDVLYVATSSKDFPFLGLAELGHIPMVAAVGATQRADRELRGDVFAGAAVVVDAMDAVLESGDGIEAIEQGWDAGSSLLLGDYLAAPATALRTLFKSIGSVEQDLVLAHH
ncbi:MAG: Ornithine cyclodeaminase, partial [Nocardioidaceae bacterium]|nr:Ornithine cyclodeaminase [Nocardioidaceae bacterium]